MKVSPLEVNQGQEEGGVKRCLWALGCYQPTLLPLFILGTLTAWLYAYFVWEFLEYQLPKLIKSQCLG